MADHAYVPRPATLGGGASERATERLGTQPDVRAMMRGAQVWQDGGIWQGSLCPHALPDSGAIYI
jgi:hypothetical protein